MVTTGAAQDGHMCVWDWKAGTLLARQPLHASGSGGSVAACFTEDGACVVTAGKEHFKVGWWLEGG